MSSGTLLRAVVLIDCRYGFKTGLSWLRAVLTSKEVASTAWLHVPVSSGLVLFDMLQTGSTCWSSWEENQKKNQFVGLAVNRLVWLQEAAGACGWAGERTGLRLWSVVRSLNFYNRWRLIKSWDKWWYSFAITFDNWTARQQFRKEVNLQGVVNLVVED